MIDDLRQLVIPGAELERVQDTELAAIYDAIDVALERVRDPNAEATRAAYRRAARAWAEWCRRVHVEPWPVRPEPLVSYLEWLSTHRAPNTVRLQLSAIASVDKWHRTTPTDTTPVSVRQSVIVQRWLKSWGRDHPRAPRRQAAAINTRQLWRLLEVINEPSPRAARACHALRAARDRAMLLMGIYGGLRVGELAALRTDDVRFVDRGLELRLPRSKTDQEGEGKWKGILPASARALCAVDAWRAWLHGRGEWSGACWVSIQRNGELGGDPLSVRTVQGIITRYAKRAGIELVSSHSMRATLATLAAERGHDLKAIADHLGHASLQTTARYVRRATVFDKNPTAGLFDE